MNRRSVVAVALAVVATACTANAAVACRVRESEIGTLLDSLPARPWQHDIVAKVEVIELLKPRFPQWAQQGVTSLVKVRVVTPIKGVRTGQIFTVDTLGTSCGQEVYQDQIGWRAYIAGRFQAGETGESVFSGAHYLISGEPVPSSAFPTVPPAAERLGGTR